ncbi:hypothetical protein [Nonomuraea recticatena]
MIHGAWLPRAVPAPRDLERLSFADDLDDRLSSLDPGLQAAARAVAADLIQEGERHPE